MEIHLVVVENEGRTMVHMVTSEEQLWRAKNRVIAGTAVPLNERHEKGLGAFIAMMQLPCLQDTLEDLVLTAQFHQAGGTSWVPRVPIACEIREALLTFLSLSEIAPIHELLRETAQQLGQVVRSN